MNTIKRDVYVLKNTIKIPIEVTQGTDMITLEFAVRDYNIPVTAAAVAYAYKGSMKKPHSMLCDVKDNVITFAPSKAFFEVGMNELQIRVIDGERALISFREKVKCTGAIPFLDEEEQNEHPSLVEQLVSYSGSETAERKAADEKEATERKKEIEVERKRIDNLAKLPSGSTTGDAELADIRVDRNGKAHPNAGEAVRQQINEIDQKYETETSSLKEDLIDIGLVLRASKWKDNFYTDGTGNEAPLNGASVTDYIDISSFYSVTIKTFQRKGVRNCFYDENHKLVLAINGTTDQWEYTEITADVSTCKYAKICTYILQKESMKIIGNLKTSLIQIMDKLNELKSMTLNDDFKNYLFASFLKFGVVGDSLSSGECYSNNTGVSVANDLYQYSWGQFIARKLHTTCYNFSEGGMTTRSWWTNKEHGWEKAQNENNKCSAYFIALGQNDYSKAELGEKYLGNISDIKENPEENADSFYGNYGKIIQKLSQLTSGCIFFLITMPDYTTNGDALKKKYNEAIKNIGKYFDNCVVLDFENFNSYFVSDPKNEYIFNNRRAGHFNAVSYNYMGMMILNMANSAMYEKNNWDKFHTVEFIGTDLNWTP